MHFAAYWQAKYVQRRNQDVREILQNARLGNTKLDLTQFDHCFWLGDLNYRIDR
jgi:hypothetical protein